MKKEIHADVIEESDEELQKAKTLKESDKLLKEETKRVRKSIGWIEPETVKWKREKSNIEEEKMMWNTVTENGGLFETESQFEAEVISYLAQVLFAVRRMEKRIKKLEKKK